MQRQQPAYRISGADDEHDHGRGARGVERGAAQLGAAQRAIGEGGDEKSVDRADRGRFGDGKRAEAHADENEDREAQARQRRAEGDDRRIPAGKRLARIIVPDRHDIGRDHQQRRHQQPGQDAGGEQRDDRDAAARRQRIDDHVVARRNQNSDERGADRDVDGDVRRVAAPFHHRDHDRADRRRVGDCRARNAAEQGRGRDVDLGQAAAEPAEQRHREIDEFFRDSAIEHDLAGIDEERNGEQRVDVHARRHALIDDLGGQPVVEDREQRRETHGEGHRRPQQQEQHHCAEQDDERHQAL